ncbi:MAG: class I SAM-dependent methyltransferase [Acidobacteriota bacterium]|nr:class I SAM-dependent methyltransferase [Acidobacteriota bacterium]
MSYRSLAYSSRQHARYWWYRRHSFVPEPLAMLDDEEWSILDAWYDETDLRGLAGECSIPAISVLQGMIGGGAISRVVQLGHFAGFSALLLGFYFRRLGRPKSLFSIDIDGECSSFTSSWIRRADLEDFVHIQVGDSGDPTMSDATASWLGDAPQLVFVDASHAYGQTVTELHLWYEATIGGGLLLFHDASGLAEDFDPTKLGGVRRALVDWEQETGVPVLLLNGGYVATTPAERLVYRDPCGLGLVQKPFDA